MASPSQLLPNLIADTAQPRLKSSLAGISVAERQFTQSAFATAVTTTPSVSPDTNYSAIWTASDASLHSVIINAALPVNAMSVHAPDSAIAVAAVKFSPKTPEQEALFPKGRGLFFQRQTLLGTLVFGTTC